MYKIDSDLLNHLTNMQFIINQTDQSQQCQENQVTIFIYDPKVFQPLQKALLLVSQQKPKNPIQFVGDYMKKIDL